MLSKKALKRKARSFIALFIVFSIVLMPVSVIAQDVGADAGGGDLVTCDSGADDSGGVDFDSGGFDSNDFGSNDFDTGDFGAGDFDAGNFGTDSSVSDTPSFDAPESDGSSAGDAVDETPTNDAPEATETAVEPGANDVDTGEVGVAEGDSAEEAPAGGNSYVVSGTPNGIVGSGLPTEFTITFTEVGTQAIGSVEIKADSSKLSLVGDKSSVVIEAPNPADWFVHLYDVINSVIEIRAVAAGGATDHYIQPGQSLSVNFTGTPQESFEFETRASTSRHGSNNDRFTSRENAPNADPSKGIVNGGVLSIAVEDTIQGAINVAADNDTIVVHPGTYNEKVLINKPINLHSVDGPESTIIYTADHNAFAPEPLADWYISNTVRVSGSGSGSTIDGFTILNGGTWHENMQVGIRILDGVEDLKIINNIIDDVLWGILLNDVWLKNSDATEIKNIIIKDNIISNSNIGIDIVFGENIIVDNNTIIFNSSCVHKPHVGISLRHGVSDIGITNNIVQGYSGYPSYFGAGIAIGTDNNDYPYSNPAGISNVNITNNEFSNNAYGMIFGNWAGLVGWQSLVPMSNINTAHNQITNNYYGVIINPSAQDEAKEGDVLVISQNTISGNIEYGIYAYSDFSGVDARHNWWGNASGPYHDDTNLGGLGNPVSDNVHFDPWWVNEEMTRDSDYVDPPAPGPGGGGDFGGGDFGFEFDFPTLPSTPTPPAATTVAPAAPQTSPLQSLVVPPADPQTEAQPLITVEFVEGGTNDELAALVAAYDDLKAYFDENYEQMSDEEYAQAYVDLTVAWAAILAREAALLAEDGADIDLDAVVEAYDAALAALDQYSSQLSEEQVAFVNSVLVAIAALIAQLSA